MNTLKSKLMLLAISFLPMIVLGDMPGPIYIHRLRRIGVDVLPDCNKFESINEECVIIVAVLLLMSIGLIVLFKRRMISLLFIWNRCKWFVCKMNRRYMVLMVLLGGFCWVIHYFGHRAMQEMSVLSLEWRKIYVNEPGWYYSDGVPDSERKAVMAKITDDLIADLQKAIDEDGYPIKWANYWQEKRAEIWSKEQALLSALKSREDLAARCKGVPIEWLVDRLVFGRWGDARNTFMEWADIHSPNLSTSENAILFKWQFYVCIKELREWRSILGISPYSRDDQEDAAGPISRMRSQDVWRQARIPESIPISSDFKDFVDDSSNGVAFVEYWHNKAKSLGYNPDPEDVALYEKRHIFKTARKIEKRKRRSFSSLNDIPSERKRDWGRKLQHCVNMDDVKGVKRLLEENAKELKDTKISFESIFDGFSGSADEMAIVRLLDEKGFKLPFKDVELTKVFSGIRITDPSVTNAVGYLIDKGADVNEVDFSGNTLLSNLCDCNWCKKNLLHVVRFLLDKGADPNLGKEPPLLAFTESYRYSPYAMESIKLLLEKGANVNVEDSISRTPLWNAVTWICDMELVKLLVAHGATITDKIIKQADKGSAIQKYLLEKSGKTEADIYPQRGSKAKFDGAPENKIDGKCSGVHSFGNDRSRRIHEEMDRYMREVREFHENRKPGESFQHNQLRQIDDEHHRRMRELHNEMR